MPEVRCIFPDCDIIAVDDDVEKAKREIVDHINQAHDEAHVICACAHDMQHVEDFDATTKDARGREISIPHERLQCSRCGQFEVRGRTETAEEPIAFIHPDTAAALGLTSTEVTETVDDSGGD